MMNLKLTLSLLACIGTPCAAQAPAASGTKKIATVAEAIDTAIEYCSHPGPEAFRFKVETEWYADGFPNMKPMSELPEAIQNFVADSSRFSPIDMVFEVRSTDGKIWLVPSNVRCDVVFTGFKNSDVENTTVSSFAENKGWTTRFARQKSSETALTQYISEKFADEVKNPNDKPGTAWKPWHHGRNRQRHSDRNPFCGGRIKTTRRFTHL